MAHNRRRNVECAQGEISDTVACYLACYLVSCGMLLSAQTPEPGAADPWFVEVLEEPPPYKNKVYLLPVQLRAG